MSAKFSSVRNKTAILFTIDTYNSATLFNTGTYMSAHYNPSTGHTYKG